MILDFVDLTKIQIHFSIIKVSLKMVKNRILSYIFVFWCFLFLQLSNSSKAQDSISQFYIQKEDYSSRLKEFDSLYGNDKSYPEEWKCEILSALSYYPELGNAKIKFVYKRFFVRATMKAGPRFFFIFQKKENRSYSIHINNNIGMFKGVDVNDLSFNALVGLFGHELGHIYDFTDESVLSIIWFGMKYSFSKKMLAKVENNTDLEAIKHGLGYGVYEFKIFLLDQPGISEKYKEKQREYYMDPDDILENIRKYDKY